MTRTGLPLEELLYGLYVLSGPFYGMLKAHQAERRGSARQGGSDLRPLLMGCDSGPLRRVWGVLGGFEGLGFWRFRVEGFRILGFRL